MGTALESKDEGEEKAWRVTLARHLRETYGEACPSLKLLRERYPEEVL